MSRKALSWTLIRYLYQYNVNKTEVMLPHPDRSGGIDVNLITCECLRKVPTDPVGSCGHPGAGFRYLPW